MGKKIHTTALVDAKAELADGVEVGPYAVIEAGVVIGEHLRRPFCRWRPTTIGAGNRFEPLRDRRGRRRTSSNGEPRGSRSATATRFASS
jgi:hypothetical protein